MAARGYPPFRALVRPALLVLGLLVGACASTQVPANVPASRRGPRGFWRANRLDRQGDRQGRWRSYFDEANTQLQTRGHYRHGQPVGRWRYYSPTGLLERRERYLGQGQSTITYLYPNGRVARQGQARVAAEPGGAHFYWFGEWRQFTETGVLDSVKTYDKGLVVARRAAR